MPGIFRRRDASTAPDATATAPDATAGDDSATTDEVDIATDAAIVPADIDDLPKAQVVEAIIASGRQDQESVVALIETLLDADLHVPMGIGADGELAMGAVMSEVDGVVYVAVFTSMDAAAHVAHMAREFSVMKGKKVIGTLRPDLGLVVETAAGKFGLVPQMLASIRSTIEAREIPADVERLANRVRSGKADIDDLVAMLMENKVVMPTPEEPKGVGGLAPVITMVNGSPRVVIAASFDAAARSSKVASYALAVDGRFIFGAIKEGVGIQLNTVVGSVDFPPELCLEVVKKYSLDKKANAATN